jgi:hypothetical protein
MNNFDLLNDAFNELNEMHGEISSKVDLIKNLNSSKSEKNKELEDNYNASLEENEKITKHVLTHFTTLVKKYKILKNDVNELYKEMEKK